jgi:hypothetical protein
MLGGAWRRRMAQAPGYRKNKATFHAVPPACVRRLPATLRPLVPAPRVGPPALPALAHAWPGRCPQRPPPAAGPHWWPPAGQEGLLRAAAEKSLTDAFLVMEADVVKEENQI